MSGGAPLILADVRSTTERTLIAEWVAEHHPGAMIVALDRDGPADAERLTEALASSDADRAVQPVRVTWLPRERGSDGRLKASELLLLGRPRRPWPVVQSFIRRTRPSGWRVTTGAPAPVRALRERFSRRYGEEIPADSEVYGARFANFVARQALLAVDRADREELGNRYKVPRLIAEQMVDDPGFIRGLRDLASTLDRSVTEVQDEVMAALEELVAVQSQLMVDLWRALVSPLHTRAWRVDADAKMLGRLRALNRDHSLVFLFSHRSYVDPLILAEVLMEHDLPRNHTIGGDNLNIWPFGPIGKRAGLVWIRRSFGDDEAYKFAVRRYLGHLMKKRFNLEWSIEGGRTRTGKLRRPKFGILRYLVDSLDPEGQADPIVIPVSLVYEQLHEVKALALEEQGGSKQAESLRWFFGYLRAQQQNLGEVLVRFGEPLNLRQALADAEGPTQLEKVAFRICTGINDVTPATSTSLVCLVLLGERDRALTLPQLQQRVAPLLDYLDSRGIERPKEDLRTSAGLGEVLARLTEAGVTEAYEGGTAAVWSVGPRRHHTAAFYRNAALHHLLNRAIVEVALLAVGTSPARCAGECGPEVHDVALALRDLLKFEFFFPDKARFGEEIAAELGRLAPDLSRLDGTAATAIEVLHDAVRADERAPLLLAHHVLRSFIDAQRIAAEVLVGLGGGSSADSEQIVTRGLALGEQMLRQRLVHGAESLSKELLTGAALLADNRGLLDAGSTAQADREAWRVEILRVTAHLRAIRALEETLRSRIASAAGRAASLAAELSAEDVAFAATISGPAASAPEDAESGAHVVDIARGGARG